MPLALLLLAALGGAGCQAPQPVVPDNPASQGIGVAQAAANAARVAAIQAQAALEPRYLRFQTEETQLGGAQDDGRHTYLEFESPVGAELQLFDQDGRPVAFAKAGRIAAVQGVHAGILVRRGERASFVSPNPRTAALPRQPLMESPEHAQARAGLENQSGQLQAMQRALEAAKLAVAAAGVRRAATVSGSPASQAAESGRAPAPAPLPQISPALPEVTYAAPPPSRSPRGLQDAVWASTRAAAPLAAANASTAAPERGLIRVFFATASRAIVAPEDGLALLLREAGNADEIRVTGFTDATGSRATNDALALARTNAVVQILLRRGIPAERIFSNAVGADAYIADNASERGRALNRRVEVLLLRNGVPLSFGGEARAMR